jgi:hypothetical protein
VILRDQRVFMGEREFTTDSMALAFEGGIEPQDDTRFQGATRIYTPGLYTAAWNAKGYWKQAVTAGDVDDTLFGDLGVNGVPVTMFGNGSAIGDRAFFLNSLESEYSFLGEVGATHYFNVGGVAADRPVRGQILHYGVETVTGSSAAVQVGAANTGKTIYAALHVIAIAGTATPTLTVRLQRDTVGFGSPTTEFTFTAATAITSQYTTDSNSSADDYWRADWTISGTTPSFTFALVMGIHTN